MARSRGSPVAGQGVRYSRAFQAQHYISRSSPGTRRGRGLSPHRHLGRRRVDPSHSQTAHATGKSDSVWLGSPTLLRVRGHRRASFRAGVFYIGRMASPGSTRSWQVTSLPYSTRASRQSLTRRLLFNNRFSIGGDIRYLFDSRSMDSIIVQIATTRVSIPPWDIECFKLVSRSHRGYFRLTMG